MKGIATHSSSCFLDYIQAPPPPDVNEHQDREVIKIQLQMHLLVTFPLHSRTRESQQQALLQPPNHAHLVNNQNDGDGVVVRDGGGGADDVVVVDVVVVRVILVVVLELSHLQELDQVEKNQVNHLLYDHDSSRVYVCLGWGWGSEWDQKV